MGSRYLGTSIQISFKSGAIQLLQNRRNECTGRTVRVNNEIAETKIKISKYEEAIEIAKIKSDMEELKVLNVRLDKLEDRLDKWISVYDGLLKKDNLLFGQAKENNRILFVGLFFFYSNFFFHQSCWEKF